MNPKEVSYSHPQLPLCDTPIRALVWPVAAKLWALPGRGCLGKGLQNYGFYVTRQGVPQKKPGNFWAIGLMLFYIRL